LKSKGLYANIHAKQERIKAGSGERMRKVGSKVRQQQMRLSNPRRQQKRAM